MSFTEFYELYKSGEVTDEDFREFIYRDSLNYLVYVDGQTVNTPVAAFEFVDQAVEFAKTEYGQRGIVIANRV